MPKVAPSAVLGGDDNAVAALYRPTAVAFDSEGQLWVVDAGNHRVLVLDSESGTVYGEIGGLGEGPGEFNFGRSPGRIAVLDDIVVVLEPVRQRISVFDKGGGLRAVFAVADSPYAVALDEDGIYLTVLTARAVEVREYSFEGEERRSLARVTLGRGDVRAPVSRFLLFSQVGVTSKGAVIQTFGGWPLIRRYGEAATERWLEFEALGNDSIAEQFRRPRRYMEEGIGLALPEELRPAVFFDVDCKDAGCFALLAHGVVQLFTEETLEPRGAVQLWEDPGSGAFPARDVAVTDDGEKLCTADTGMSAVRCYDIGELFVRGR